MSRSKQVVLALDEQKQLRADRLEQKRQWAERLRSDGLSLKQIARQVGAGHATVKKWLEGVSS